MLSIYETKSRHFIKLLQQEAFVDPEIYTDFCKTARDSSLHLFKLHATEHIIINAFKTLLLGALISKYLSNRKDTKFEVILLFLKLFTAKLHFLTIMPEKCCRRKNCSPN